MSEEENQNYRQMILQLSNIIKPEEELRKMIFFCKDIIKASQRDKIKDFLTLITILEERKRVGPDKLDFLRELLRHCTNGRRDVFDPVDQYERPGQVSMDATPEYPNNRQRDYSDPALEEPIEFLKRKLGKDWRFFARAIKVEDEEIDNLMDEFPRNVKEQIYRAIKIYLNRRREQACIEDFIAACRDIRRIDLARKLEANDYT